jgi:hypothetical protein
MARGGAFALLLTGIALLVVQTSPAQAQPPLAADADSAGYFVSVHGETRAELFRRAFLPAAGALVTTVTTAPLRQYVLVRARELDTDPEQGTLDFELAAWSSATLGQSHPERPLDGDVQTANVGYRRGALGLRLGRQQVAGGAARFARFDGAAFSAELGSGLRTALYGGFTVLPRWNARPGYHYLGAAVDSDLRQPDALPEPERENSWLAGGSVGWSTRAAAARLSFHEQRGDLGLVRRNLGADARVAILDDASVGGNGLVALDSMRVADARLFADWTPLRELSLSVEGLHAEPALLLSRESVLSVFSTAGFDEVGAVAGARLTRAFSLEARGFSQLYAGGEPGARAELASRVALDHASGSFARVAYSRVLAPDNGYHTLRSSLARRLLPSISGTLEAYAYLYDKAIRGRRVSSVYAATLTYETSSSLSALWGASIAESPYARFDAQTQIALAYDFDFVGIRGTR